MEWFRLLLLVVLLLFPRWQSAFGEESQKAAVTGEAWVGFLENGKDITFAFKFADGRWQVLGDSRPSDVYKKSWTVAWDGKNLGTAPVFSTPSLNEFILHTPLIRKTLNIPWGERWDQKTFPRPFVVVSPANFKDPNFWKPIRKLNLKTTRKVTEKFLQDIPDVFICIDDRNETWKKVPLKPEDLKIVDAYGSNIGEFLISVKSRFDEKEEKCGMPDPTLYTQTFFLQKDGEIFNLTRYKNPCAPTGLCNDDDRLWSLKLVDAGDYNNDGFSEMIFFLSGYDENGYVLVDGRTRTAIKYVWFYH